MLFLSLVFLQLVLFVILLFFLRSVLTRNITTATAHLTELNQEYSQKEEAAKKHVEEAKEFYDQTVLKAKTDVEKQTVQILKEANETQEGLLREARKQSEEILAQANKARDTLLKEVEQKIGEKAMEQACEWVQHMLPQELSKSMHAQWLEELSAHGLEDLGRLNFPGELHEAQVVSAYALSADQRELLQKELKDKLKRNIRLNERVDPKLIAGFTIYLGSAVIDGSLKFKIKEMAKHAQRRAEN